MKILLINYRYFVSGGPERYMFNVKEALEAQGHEIIPFSVNYQNNQSTEYSKYFVTPLDKSGGVYFSEHNSDLGTYLKTIERLVYAHDVEKMLTELIRLTKPDVAYVLHYLRKLSPSVLVALKTMKVPIVVRLSDYQMLCPQSHFLRRGIPCELCVTESNYMSVKYNCVKGSKIASTLDFLATKFHKWKGYFDYIDKFVLTNVFAKEMMVKGGFEESRMIVIPTFVNEYDGVEHIDKEYLGEYITYVGRLDPIKGIDLLVEAFCKLLRDERICNVKLLVIGDGDESYKSDLMTTVVKADASESVKFLGSLTKPDIDDFLAGALFNVLPSRCYENLPNVVLESFMAGTPVLASNFGSLPELVEGGTNGMLFDPFVDSDLSNKIVELLSNRELLETISGNCKMTAQKSYSQSTHIAKLIETFQSVIVNDDK